VIAAVHGPVLGLGVDVIAAYDIRLPASSASFAIKEIDVGFAAGLGTLAYLPKNTENQSLIQGRELAYTGPAFSAVGLQTLLVSRVIDGGNIRLLLRR